MTKKRIEKFCRENKIPFRDLDSFFDSDGHFGTAKVYEWEIFINGEWVPRMSYGGTDLDYEFSLILEEVKKED